MLEFTRTGSLQRLREILMVFLRTPECKILLHQETEDNGYYRHQHIGRRRPHPELFDQQFDPRNINQQVNTIHHQVTKKLGGVPQRRSLERNVFLKPEPGQNGNRGTDKLGGDVGGKDKNPDIPIYLIENIIVTDKIQEPIEQQVRYPAKPVTKQLPGNILPDKRKIKPVDRLCQKFLHPYPILLIEQSAVIKQGKAQIENYEPFTGRLFKIGYRQAGRSDGGLIDQG